MSNILISKLSLLQLSNTVPKIITSYRRIVYLNTSLFKHLIDEEVFNQQFNRFSTNIQLKTQNEYKVTFIKANGDRVTGKGKEGDSLLDVVVNNNLDFDGFGACEGTLTCSTCHCIFKQEDYDRLPEKPCDEELDMLDLAYDLTPTSRLGCQIQLTKELDGLEVRIPATVNDARS